MSVSALCVAVATEALRKLSTQTSLLDQPDLMPTEALQRCQQDSKPLLAPFLPAPSKAPQDRSHKHHHHHHHHHKHGSGGHRKQSKSSKRGQDDLSSAPPGKKARPRQASPAPHTLTFTPSLTSIKTETLASCSLSQAPLPIKVEAAAASSSMSTASSTALYEQMDPSPAVDSATSDGFLPASGGLDSPSSYDSAIELSPPGFSQDLSLLGDLPQGPQSCLHSVYDAQPVEPAASPVTADFLHHRHFSPAALGAATNPRSVLADLEDFDPPDFVDAIYESYDSSSGLSSPRSAYPGPVLAKPAADPRYDGGAGLGADGGLALDQVDTGYLLDNVDQQLLGDPSVLMDMPARSFLGGDFHCPFDLLLASDFDVSDITMGDSGLLAL